MCLLCVCVCSGLSDGRGPARLRSQLSITEVMAVSREEQQLLLGSEETGLQEHSDSNCLYCAGLSVLGLSSQHTSSGASLFSVQ